MLTGLLFGVEPVDPITIGVSAVLLVAVALVRRVDSGADGDGGRSDDGATRRLTATNPSANGRSKRVTGTPSRRSGDSVPHLGADLFQFALRAASPLRDDRIGVGEPQGP